MDHGQFQVGVGVVHRDAAVFGQKQDEKEQGNKEPLRGQRAGKPLAEHPGQGQGRGIGGQGQQGQEQHGFGQGGKGGLAAGPHAFEARSGVQGGQDDGQPRQPQAVGGQHEVAGKAGRGRAGRTGQQAQRAAYGGQGHGRPDPQHEACGVAFHQALACQFGQIEIGLQQRLADAAGHKGLDPVDDAGDQRGQDKGGEDVEPGVHESFQAKRSTTVAST